MSVKSNTLKIFAYITAFGHPLQTQICPVYCHSYSYLCINFGLLISIFVRAAKRVVTLTLEF